MRRTHKRRLKTRKRHVKTRRGGAALLNSSDHTLFDLFLIHIMKQNANEHGQVSKLFPSGIPIFDINKFLIDVNKSTGLNMEPKSFELLVAESVLGASCKRGLDGISYYIPIFPSTEDIFSRIPLEIDEATKEMIGIKYDILIRYLISQYSEYKSYFLCLTIGKGSLDDNSLDLIMRILKPKIPFVIWNEKMTVKEKSDLATAFSERYLKESKDEIERLIQIAHPTLLEKRSRLIDLKHDLGILEETMDNINKGLKPYSTGSKLDILRGILAKTRGIFDNMVALIASTTGSNRVKSLLRTASIKNVNHDSREYTMEQIQNYRGILQKAIYDVTTEIRQLEGDREIIRAPINKLMHRLEESKKKLQENLKAESTAPNYQKEGLKHQVQVLENTLKSQPKQLIGVKEQHEYVTSLNIQIQELQKHLESKIKEIETLREQAEKPKGESAPENDEQIATLTLKVSELEENRDVLLKQNHGWKAAYDESEVNRKYFEEQNTLHYEETLRLKEETLRLKEENERVKQVKDAEIEKLNRQIETLKADHSKRFEAFKERVRPSNKSPVGPPRPAQYPIMNVRHE